MKRSAAVSSSTSRSISKMPGSIRCIPATARFEAAAAGLRHSRAPGQYADAPVNLRGLILRNGKNARPVLCRMKNTNNHNRFLKRLVKNQVVVKSWNNEPADLRVTRSGIADAPSKFLMLCEKIGGVENGSTDTLRRFRIVSGNVVGNLVQVARGFGTESGPDHDRRRNSSVVLDCSRFSSPSSSSRSSSGVITTSMP